MSGGCLEGVRRCLGVSWGMPRGYFGGVLEVVLGVSGECLWGCLGVVWEGVLGDVWGGIWMMPGECLGWCLRSVRGVWGCLGCWGVLGDFWGVSWGMSGGCLGDVNGFKYDKF